MANKIRIELVRGLSGTKPFQRKTIKALGLRKINGSVEKDDNPAIRGMINTVAHLVHFKEIS